MATVSVPSISGEGNLTRYLQEIRKFPMLEPNEEYMLAKRWKEQEDPEAAHRLVTSHLRLVAKIAMGYRGYGLPLSELISEGNVGMMQAVKRLDPGIHPPFLVAGEDRHHRRAEEAVLQPPPAQRPNPGDRGRRSDARACRQNRQGARRPRKRRRQHESPSDGARQFAQCAVARRQRRRMAGLAGR